MNLLATYSLANQLPPLVLVVEDSDEDYEALDRSFRQYPVKARLHRYKTGKQALEYLDQCMQAKQEYPKEVPNLILLDLNLPGMNGKDVLRSIKQNPLLQHLPTVVLTTSSNLTDIKECYRLGANSYLVKMVEWQKFKQSMQVMIEYWLNTATSP